MTKLRSRSRRSRRVRSLVVIGAIGLVADVAPSRADVSCPQTSTPTNWCGSFLDTNTTKSGSTFNAAASRLELSTAGASFHVKQNNSPTTMVYTAVGDFNKDGWQDFVGSAESTSGAQLTIQRNFTWQNENCTTTACTAFSGTPPNWADPTFVVLPKFTATTNLRTSGLQGRFAIIAGDFNGDHWDDVFEAVALDSDSNQIKTINVYLNKAVNDGSGNAQFNAGYAAQSGFTVSTVLGKQTWSGTSIQAVDYNKDGKQDILIGTGASGGSIRILLNNCPGSMQPDGVFKCTSAPKFTDGGYLIFNLNTGNSGFGTNVSGGLPVFTYGDADGDGLRDLLVSAPNCCTQSNMRMRLFKGCAGGAGCTAGLQNVASQSIATNGAATGVFLADFSLDGKPDVVYTTDHFNYDPTHNGGTSFFYKNNGTTTPFSGGLTQQLTFGLSPDPTDYDVGLLMDYDHDPTLTPDILVADGNHSGGFYVIADRNATLYADCGDAFSGEIDLGSLLSQEMVVTAARITPTVVLNGGTVTFFMSNENPQNWVQANLCSGSASDYCVSFPKPVGRSVRWKAAMCSNSFHTTTPFLSAMSAKFDYTPAKEHYRAGTIASDGIVYVGAFKQPGERGKFYALPAGLTNGPKYWDASTKLDQMADANRNIYTSAANLAVRIDFKTSEASNALLQNVLTTADSDSTTDLINWVRSARFGVGTVDFPLTRLGSVESSTPAILIPPARPNWYSFVTAIDRIRIDAFISAKATRKPLVLFGAKDGMIHAVHSRAAETPVNAINGTEAWAYIPPTVAKGMLADRTATALANAVANNGTNNPKIASYPDGSPTLVDIHVGNGVFKTIAAVAEGNGGKSFTVLDVTETIDPVTDTVLGPTPMWSATPGGSEAGQAYTKPVVARVLIGNAERFLVIAATGLDFNDTYGEKGRVVAAYDADTGTVLWRFQTKCAVTSDLTVFETDDVKDGDGTSTLNGYVDRVVFSDKCGYVYKIAPGVDLAGEFLENTGMAGTCATAATDCVDGLILANTTTDGKKQFAVFSTQRTTGALGTQRPIAGTIAARTDSSTRMVLFFGTGGVESVSASLQNEFYAIYADTGEVRSKFVGACGANGCEKFYNGIVVTPEQVILTKTVDPLIGTGSCDSGSSTVSGLQLDADTNHNFVSSGLNQAVTAAIMAGLFGDAGAIYFATLAGDVIRIGTPRVSVAGGDTAAGYTQGMGVGDQGTGTSQVGTVAPFTLMGWRVVL